MLIQGWAIRGPHVAGHKRFQWPAEVFMKNLQI